MFLKLLAILDHKEYYECGQIYKVRKTVVRLYPTILFALW